MNSIKKHRLLILILLLVYGQLVIGQQAPEPPIITSVTVKPLPNNPGAVEIVWKKSPTPNVNGYILYRYIIDDKNNGYTIINKEIRATDSVYIDTEAQGNIKSESYFIESYFGNREIIGLHCPAHATLFLSQLKYDSCSMTNTLSWNPYESWDNGVIYNIVDNNGDIIPGGGELRDTVFTHNIDPDNTYSYSIIAVQEENSSVHSSSNQQTVYTTAIKQPNPNNFYIKNISYNGSTASFTVKIDNTADLLGHSLLVSSNEESGFSIAAYKEIESSESIEFLHTVENQPLFYKVVAIDVCHDTVLETNVAKPILLIATELTETDVTLEWNQSYIESTEVYTLNITIDGNSDTPLPAAEKLAKFNFQQDLDPENIGEEFCFKVEATETLGYKSVSNLVCISRLPLIEFPNAFTPNGDGINDYFGPFSNYIKNVDISSGLFEFKLIIYDKYGGAIYESDNVFQKWTGVNNRASLKYVPEGAYIYYMWFKSAQGKSYEKSGTINVVYP